MAWYSASLIIGMKRRDGKGVISVHEDVVLINAENAEQAHEFAVEEGEFRADADDGLTINDHPADYVFAGVRKVLIVDDWEPGITVEAPAGIVGEISYNEFEVPDEGTLQRLGRGESVEVLYLE